MTTRNDSSRARRGFGFNPDCERARLRERAMTLDVRRIVTGHDAAGKAVIASDERMQAAASPTRPGISRVEIWSTDRMPVDNSEGAAAEAQRNGFVVRHNYVGSGQETII